MNKLGATMFFVLVLIVIGLALYACHQAYFA